ncbi:hypothetical protein [Brachybacterium kimchii]|uniref:Uncharacterized protein n=1 Tax=Brachybacterium kimchii TaxID=2942909 RepID=A0ABY4N7T5_9MICO|nr:hypothetical protein [Brachybacterium kimchii]UQN29465.1 hypothetical protein M4486_17800 [Brachybacterium kimchii]
MNPTHDWQIDTHSMELVIRRDEEDSIGVHLGHDNMDDAHATTILTSRLLEMIETVQPGAVRAWAASLPPTDAERIVRDLHREVIVYELDSANGTWVYGDDDERIVLRRFCAECSSEDVIHAVEDQDWMEDWGYAHEVDYPCDTIRALTAAREAQR